MKTILLSISTVIALGMSSKNFPALAISVGSQLRCGSDVYAVLRVSNTDGQNSVFIPLTSSHDGGSAVYDVRLEVLKGDQWHSVGRGADAPSSSRRELRPGEKFDDVFQLPTRDRDTALSRLPQRLVVPYIFNGIRREVRTSEFREELLPIDNRESLCPSASTRPK